MKIKKALVLLLLTAWLIKPAFSAPVSLFGVPDCGQWINRKSAPDQAWLLGFLGGLNWASVNKDGANALKNVNSADQIFVWMTNYCQKNPMSSLSEGGFVLFEELAIKEVIKDTFDKVRKDLEKEKK